MSKKYIILFTVFVDILGLGIVIPVLPFYVQSFGASAVVVTLLFSIFSLCSFISAPFLGALSDKIGRRPILLISIASTAVGWLVFSSAKVLWLLFLGRIIDGLAAGNLPIAQSYLTDIAKDDKERTNNLGLIGGMFGLGLTIGPGIGGLLAHFGSSTPFWFASALSFINLFLAFWFLPETHIHRDTDQKVETNPFGPIIRALKNKPLLPGFAAWFLFGLAIAVQQSVFSLFLQSAFNFNATVAGWFLVGVGIVLSLNQAIFLRRVWLKKFSEPFLELFMLGCLTVGFALLSGGNLWVFIFGLAVFTIAHSVLRVIMTSQVVAQAPSARGEVLGIMSSIMSLSMIIGPLASGFLFEWRPWLPFVVAAAISAITFAVVIIFKNKFNASNLPDDASPAIAL